MPFGTNVPSSNILNNSLSYLTILTCKLSSIPPGRGYRILRTVNLDRYRFCSLACSKSAGLWGHCSLKKFGVWLYFTHSLVTIRTTYFTELAKQIAVNNQKNMA